MRCGVREKEGEGEEEVRKKDEIIGYLQELK